MITSAKKDEEMRSRPHGNSSLTLGCNGPHQCFTVPEVSKLRLMTEKFFLSCRVITVKHSGPWIQNIACLIRVPTFSRQGALKRDALRDDLL